MNRDNLPFWIAVDEIRARHPRYRREAYGFLMLALAHVVEALPADRREDPGRRHVSGQELLRGVARLARVEFGVLAPMVFREWGLERSADVGEIVFDLVGAGQLSARPEDRREDFAGPDLERLLTTDFGTPSSPPPGEAGRVGGKPDP